jgi:protein SCO1/2
MARLAAGALVAALTLLLPPAAQVAETAQPDENQVLRTSQAAIGRTLGEYTFTTSRDTPFTLEQLRGRPVVLSLVYTSCYYVCSGLTLRLREAVKVARAALGPQSFNVVTVGFDTPNDTPERMHQFARERGVDQAGWYFVSADARTMAQLVRDVGFTYFPSPKGFDHVTQTTIVDRAGRVVLQVYGDDFAPPLVVDPLKRLVWGQGVERNALEGLLNRVKLVCTIYDPSSGRYRFDYSLIVELIAGGLAFGIAAVAIAGAMRNVR